MVKIKVLEGVSGLGKPNSKTLVALVLVALVILVGLPILLRTISGGAHEYLPITIAAPVGPADGPLYVAYEKGYLSEEGLNATIVPFTSGRLALDALLTGNAQVAMVAETPLALAAFQNQKFLIVATIAESPHKLVVKKRIGVPQGLKGKKVSTLAGSAGEFWMYSFLKANGLSASDVKAISLQPTDMVLALTRGDIDAFFSWEPYPYLAKKELKDEVAVYSSKGIYAQTFNVVVMQDFSKDNSKTIERLIKALIKAEKFMQENKAESVKIVAKNSKMDENVLNGIWDDHKFAIMLDQSLLAYLREQGNWAKSSGIVPANSETPDYRAFIQTEPLDRLNPARVTIK